MKIGTGTRHCPSKNPEGYQQGRKLYIQRHIRIISKRDARCGVSDDVGAKSEQKIGHHVHRYHTSIYGLRLNLTKTSVLNLYMKGYRIANTTIPFCTMH